MPLNIIKSFADKSGKSKQEVEDLWNKAKDVAKKENKKDDYDYIVGILKNMLKLEDNKSQTFSDFLDNY